MSVENSRFLHFGRDDNCLIFRLVSAVAFGEEDVEVGGYGLGVELAHHEGDLAAV